MTKHDAEGNFEWTKQLGTPSNDFCYGVSADGLGNVYISGSTSGSLGGPSAGDDDAFVSRYDSAGNFHWTVQLGTTEEESSRAISADGRRSLYISGPTKGGLFGPNEGFDDAFVARYIVPEPAIWLLALFSLSCLAGHRPITRFRLRYVRLRSHRARQGS